MNCGFIHQLNRNNIEALLIGGRAMNMLGSDRMTTDYDFLLNIDSSNFEILYEIISIQLGYEPKFQANELLEQKKKIPLPGMIEIITSVDGVNFKDIYKRAIDGIIEGEIIKYPCPKDMIELKRVSSKDSSRVVDLEDIAFLESLCA